MREHIKRPPAMGVFVDEIIHGIGARLSDDGISFGKGMTTMFLAIYHDRTLLDRMATIMTGPDVDPADGARHAYILVIKAVEAAENPARILLQEFQETLLEQKKIIPGDPGQPC